MSVVTGSSCCARTTYLFLGGYWLVFHLGNKGGLGRYLNSMATLGISTAPR